MKKVSLGDVLLSLMASHLKHTSICTIGINLKTATTVSVLSQQMIISTEKPPSNERFSYTQYAKRSKNAYLTLMIRS